MALSCHCRDRLTLCHVRKPHVPSDTKYVQKFYVKKYWRVSHVSKKHMELRAIFSCHSLQTSRGTVVTQMTREVTFLSGRLPRKMYTKFMAMMTMPWTTDPVLAMDQPQLRQEPWMELEKENLVSAILTTTALMSCQVNQLSRVTWILIISDVFFILVESPESFLSQETRVIELIWDSFNDLHIPWSHVFTSVLWSWSLISLLNS